MENKAMDIINADTFDKTKTQPNLHEKLLEAEQQRLSGAATYTVSEVRDYIRGLHDTGGNPT
jgi:hypothetical protein